MAQLQTIHQKTSIVIEPYKSCKRQILGLTNNCSLCEHNNNNIFKICGDKLRIDKE